MFGGFPFGTPTFGDAPIGTGVILLPPTADTIIQVTADDITIVVPSDDDELEP